ncbi:hypothetical protein EMIT091MI3_150055 [Kosakonia quasisacchari]
MYIFSNLIVFRLKESNHLINKVLFSAGLIHPTKVLFINKNAVTLAREGATGRVSAIPQH